MTDEEDEVVESEQRPSAPEIPAWVGVATWIVRGLTRLWVISLILFAAAFAGISVYQLGQSHAALTGLEEQADAEHEGQRDENAEGVRVAHRTVEERALVGIRRSG